MSKVYLYSQLFDQNLLCRLILSYCINFTNLYLFYLRSYLYNITFLLEYLYSFWKKSPTSLLFLKMIGNSSYPLNVSCFLSSWCFRISFSIKCDMQMAYLAIMSHHIYSMSKCWMTLSFILVVIGLQQNEIADYWSWNIIER